MKKDTIVAALVVGAGVFALWAFTRPKRDTVPVPVTLSTGSLSQPPDMFSGLRSIAQAATVRYDNTGDIITAAGGALQQVPGILKGIGELFKKPAHTVTALPSADSLPTFSPYLGIPQIGYDSGGAAGLTTGSGFVRTISL